MGKFAGMDNRNPILRMLIPSKSLIIWTLVVLFITMCIDIATPLFSQVFVDGIITHKHPEWELPVSILLVIFLIISVLNVFVGYYTKRALQTKYQIKLCSSLFWHAIRMPVQVFGKITPSDFSVRFNNGNMTFARRHQAQAKRIQAQLGRVQSIYSARESAVRLYKALGM